MGGALIELASLRYPDCDEQLPAPSLRRPGHFARLESPMVSLGPVSLLLGVPGSAKVGPEEEELDSVLQEKQEPQGPVGRHLIGHWIDIEYTHPREPYGPAYIVAFHSKGNQYTIKCFKEGPRMRVQLNTAGTEGDRGLPYRLCPDKEAAELSQFDSKEQFDGCRRMGFESKKEYEDCLHFGFLTKEEYDDCKALGIETKNEYHGFKQSPDYVRCRRMGFTSKSDYDESKRLGMKNKAEWDDYMARFVSTKPLLKMVERGNVVLLDGHWLVELHHRRHILPPRQELPKGATIDAEKLGDLDAKGMVTFFSVSYPWITPQHPDPEGFHLAIIAQVIELYMHFTGKRVAVFWDWASIHQDFYAGTTALLSLRQKVDYPEGLQKTRRTDQERELFKEALATINDWYCNSKTTVLLQTHSPEESDQDFELHVDLSALWKVVYEMEAQAMSRGLGPLVSMDDFMNGESTSEEEQQQFEECLAMGFDSKDQYDECKMYGFASKSEYNEGMPIARAFFGRWLKDSLRIRCFPGSTTVEDVSNGAPRRGRALIKAGHSITSVDCALEYNDELAPVKLGNHGRDYFCGRPLDELGWASCSLEDVACPSCLRLKQRLMPWELKKGCRVVRRRMIGNVVYGPNQKGFCRLRLEDSDREVRVLADELEPFRLDKSDPWEGNASDIKKGMRVQYPRELVRRGQYQKSQDCEGNECFLKYADDSLSRLLRQEDVEMVQLPLGCHVLNTTKAIIGDVVYGPDPEGECLVNILDTKLDKYIGQTAYVKVNELEPYYPVVASLDATKKERVEDIKTGMRVRYPKESLRHGEVKRTYKRGDYVFKQILSDDNKADVLRINCDEGDCIIKYLDGTHSGILHRDDVDVLLPKEFPEEVRAEYRKLGNPHAITTPADVCRILNDRWQAGTKKVAVAFKRKHYHLRGWCEFEMRISQMITPASRLLDLGYLLRIMGEWSCGKNLHMFIDRYKENGGKKNPETWEEFIQMTNSKGEVVIDLLKNRSDPPMLPDDFAVLLKGLNFTNGSDKAFVDEKYREIFQKIFTTAVDELDFGHLGWEFPVANLAPLLRICAPRLKRLDLAGNDLQGGLIELVQLGDLDILQSLDMGDNKNLEGSLDPLMYTLDKLNSLSLKGCSNVTGAISGPMVTWLSGMQFKNLWNCGRMVLAGDLNSSIKNVTSIDLSFCNTLEGDTDAFSNLVHLKHLNLYYCENLVGNLEPLSSCPALVSLKCGACWGLTGTLDPLACCTNLTDLNMSGNGMK